MKTTWNDRNISLTEADLWPTQPDTRGRSSCSGFGHCTSCVRLKFLSFFLSLAASFLQRTTCKPRHNRMRRTERLQLTKTDHVTSFSQLEQIHLSASGCKSVTRSFKLLPVFVLFFSCFLIETVVKKNPERSLDLLLICGGKKSSNYFIATFLKMHKNRVISVAGTTNLTKIMFRILCYFMFNERF